jgi:hypothetical protein
MSGACLVVLFRAQVYVFSFYTTKRIQYECQ